MALISVIVLHSVATVRRWVASAIIKVLLAVGSNTMPQMSKSLRAEQCQKA